MHSHKFLTIQQGYTEKKTEPKQCQSVLEILSQHFNIVNMSIKYSILCHNLQADTSAKLKKTLCTLQCPLGTILKTGALLLSAILRSSEFCQLSVHDQGYNASTVL